MENKMNIETVVTDNILLESVWLRLRPYQQEGVRHLLKKDVSLNFDDMGLGKTVTTLFASLCKYPELFEYGDFPNHKLLVVCPSKALYVWKKELEDWFNMSSLIYTGTPAQRRKLQDQFMWYPVVITTYGMLAELKDFSWCQVIADEIHEAGLLNHKTKTYKTMNEYAKRGIDMYLLTGTPIRQGVIDLFAPLHLVAPTKFRDYWPFVNKYCITIETPFGKQIQRNPKNVPEFRAIINNYMVRRIKSEVLHDLPGKQRNIIPIAMTKLQKQAYHDMLETFVYADEDTIAISPNAMSALLRARQIMCTPRLLGIDEDGGALDYIAQEGKNLLENDRPIVIFTPFRSAIPIIKDVIDCFKLGTKIYTISGGLKPSEFANQWQGFQESMRKNKALICVIKSGASFHATESSDCFFLGYEWDFNLNAQAEDRLCRLGQQNFVQCNYLLYNDCEVDQEIRRTLNDKSSASIWAVGTEQQYRTLLAAIKRGHKLK